MAKHSKAYNEAKAKLEEVTLQFSQVLSHSKPAMDGFYDNRDSKHELQLMQDTLAELHSKVLREMTLIEASTGISSKVSQIWQKSPLNKS